MKKRILSLFLMIALVLSFCVTAFAKANMFVARWMAAEGMSYDMETNTSYETSYTNPAKWYDIDPREMVPNMGNVIRQYSGNVHISLRGVNTIVDQLVANMPDPSVRQFEI